jgi:hypothetical protein
MSERGTVQDGRPGPEIQEILRAQGGATAREGIPSHQSQKQGDCASVVDVPAIRWTQADFPFLIYSEPLRWVADYTTNGIVPESPNQPSVSGGKRVSRSKSRLQPPSRKPTSIPLEPQIFNFRVSLIRAAGQSTVRDRKRLSVRLHLSLQT